MGVEVAGSELPKVNGETKVAVHDKENGKVHVPEPIAFGSHGVEDQPAKGKATDVSNGSLPENAVEEWPAEPQVHSFWMVKYRAYEDPKMRAEMDKIEKDIQKKSIQISALYDELNAAASEKKKLHIELDSLGEEKSQYNDFITQRKQEMRPWQDALGELRGPGRERGVAICSSEQELNARIRSFEYQMQHESLTLKEEKQIIREIKELEATRPKVIANSVNRAKVVETMGPKEAILDQVKLLGTDLDGVKKQKGDVLEKRNVLSKKILALREQKEKLMSALDEIKKKKKEAVESIQELRKKRDDGNVDFYGNRSFLINAKELAAKKDVKALEELVNTEVERFMSEWNSSKAFRTDYEKRALFSLDMRQLSRDGRMRNFDEKPLVMAEAPVTSDTTVASKAKSKPQKEEPKITSKAEDLPSDKVQNESKKGSKDIKTVSERDLEEDIFVVEKPKKAKDNEIDAAKLKEMKKEEEKEKQRQALERKKKLQEKAAAKAALRAQKEADKKQKEREKKSKKKEASSGQPTNEEEPSEIAEVDEADKSDNVEETIEESAPLKAKEQKGNALRHRKPTKTRGTLPKAILKKKKSANYWLWGSAAAAAVVVLLLLVFGYKYLL